MIAVQRETESRGGSSFLSDTLRVGDTLPVTAPAPIAATASPILVTTVYRRRRLPSFFRDAGLCEFAKGCRFGTRCPARRKSTGYAVVVDPAGGVVDEQGSIEDRLASILALPKHLGEQAYERLLDMLLTGELQGGTTLQERRLAEILNISRTPVREALSRLESEGLITRHGGRLMTVFKVSAQEFIEVFEVRKLLEVEAAGLAAEGRMNRETVETIRAAMWRLLEVEQPSTAEHWAADDLVHGAIAEAAQNTLLATVIRDLRRRTHIFNTRRIPQRLRPGTLEHLAMIDAVASGDRDRAMRLMAEHLENAKRAVVSQLLVGRRD